MSAVTSSVFSFSHKIFAQIPLSRNQFVFPLEDPWLFVHFVQIPLNPSPQLLLRVHSDAVWQGPCLFPEEGLYQIEPRPVLGGENELESIGYTRELSSSLPGDMRRVIVQHQSNASARRDNVGGPS